MRESPAWIQAQSPAGFIRNAASVLCGSSSLEIAVSLITVLASSSSCRSTCTALVASRLVAREELTRRHQHLVRGLAPAAAPAHAVGDDAEHAARRSRVVHDQDLILLVGAVPLVKTGGGCESKAWGRGRGGDGGAVFHVVV